MKRILFLCVLVLGTIGCKTDDGDPRYGYDLIYINQISSDITVQMFYTVPDQDTEGILSYEFIIPANGEHTRQEWAHSKNPDDWGFWKYYPTGSYAEISNGEVKVTFVIEDEVSIFNLDNYIRILEDYNDINWVYVYVFTDDFFADGEPITPAEPQ